jgi:hypothetical protein
MRTIQQAVALLVCSVFAQASMFAAETQTSYYEGRPLDLRSGLLFCVGSQFVAIGTGPGGIGVIQKDLKTADTWNARITLKKNTADLFWYDGSVLRSLNPVHYDLSQSGRELLLVYKRVSPHAAPETITIDPRNSSFVYSFQHSDEDGNFVNVFYGVCTVAKNRAAVGQIRKFCIAFEA